MDAGSALQQAVGQGNNVGTLLQQEKTELGPMQQAVAQTSAQQIPAPQLEKAPKAPEFSIGQDATAWMGTLNVLAGLGGLKSRQGSTAALQAFSAGFDGLKKGKVDQFKQAQTQWTDANNQVIENNKAQVDAYKEALQDKKLSVDEQMAGIKIIASQYHNDIVAQLAEQRNFTAIARVIDMMQKNNDELKLQYEKLQKQIDKAGDHAKDALDATKAYANLYAPGGVVQKGAPPFMQWYKSDWQTIEGKAGDKEQPSSATEGAPPANLLKEGVHTTFDNGQTWTLENGVPQQVK